MGLNLDCYDYIGNHYHFYIPPLIHKIYNSLCNQMPLSASEYSAQTFRIQMSEDSKRRDEKCVHGFVKKHYSSKMTEIPADIMNLMFLFFHIVFNDTFQHYNPDGYHVSNDGMDVKRKGPGRSLCYGSECIPSSNKGIYSWKFHLTKFRGWLAIGIDETKYTRKDMCHFNERKSSSKSYALWEDGGRNKWNYPSIIPSEADAPDFESGDIVVMTLDLWNKTLSYQVNEDPIYTAFDDIFVAEDIEYCFGVYLSVTSDTLQLLECNAF